MDGLTVTRKFEGGGFNITLTDQELIEYISGMKVDERIVLIRKIFEKDSSKSFLLKLLNDLIAKR